MPENPIDIIEEKARQNGGKVDFDAAIEDAVERSDSEEAQIRQGIYQSERVKSEWTADGEHHVIKAIGEKESPEQESVLQGFDGVASELELEPGEPTGEKYKNLEILGDIGHPLVPEEAPYFARRMEGQKTDLQVFTYDMSESTPSGVQHVLLTGLPGVGKNQAIKHICAKTNRPLIRIPVGGGIRYEDLVGHYSPTEEGSLEWTDGILTTAVRYGFTVVLDEIDMMTGDVSSPLHQVTEDGDSQELVIRQTGEVVEPHPEFRVVATRNPSFAGSNQMNRAFLSRWSEHEVGYLSKKAETKVLTSAIDGLDEDDIEPVVEYANELRERYPQEIDLVVTTRDLKRIGDYVADGFFDTKAAVRKVILPRANPDTDRDPLEEEIETRNW